MNGGLRQAEADPGFSSRIGFGLVLPFEYCARAMNIADDHSAPNQFVAAVSPSLGSPRGAFETKFIVEHAIALAIQDWARQHLDADPHAGGEGDEGYHVNSVYLDTPNFDTYRRNPFYRRRKFRLRRYGNEATIGWNSNGSATGKSANAGSQLLKPTCRSGSRSHTIENGTARGFSVAWRSANCDRFAK